MNDITWIWILIGAIALILATVNLICGMMKKHRGWQAVMLVSLSCGCAAVLIPLRSVNSWLRSGDWAAIEDEVPALSTICTLAVCLGITLNLLALWLHLRER